jgi:trehalose synthase
MRTPSGAPAVTARPGRDSGLRRQNLTRRPSEHHVRWLEARSMLYRAEHICELVAGTHLQWRHAFADPRPGDFIRAASVWFTNYPKSIITAPRKSVLQTLADDGVLAAFRNIGIEGIHLGPMKRAGGISGRKYTPTTDGFFDRIELEVDPLFGAEQHYIELSRAARKLGILIIGDLVPAHTGKGADFRLAELGYKNYEGLYTMVPIPPEDWCLLPPVLEGADCVNLSEETAQILEDKGYIPGPTEVIPFYDPGMKDTCWSATAIVTGVDGVRRRWVYLHIFKSGQPSFNWLDPTFGAQRIVMADVIQSLHILGDGALRLDANPLLGIEGKPGKDPSWIEGHPVAVGGSNMIAMMVRKLGGYSFQELNLPLDELKEFTRWGADLSYDFITRPAYLHAIATGDAGPLRLILRVTQEEGLDLGRFVHALQNHDELMFDVSHLRKHGHRAFSLDGVPTPGRAIYDSMYERTRETVIGSGASHVHEFSNLGFCATLTSFAAAAAGISDPYSMSAAQKADVQRFHVLAATFNAMQPGVFALSGWDLVGALSVPPESLGAWLEDGDGRWMNRGAFDLMGVNPTAATSRTGLPRAVAIYGTLLEQLRNPSSFASQLERMLRARKASGVAHARLISVAEVRAPGLVVMLFADPSGSGWIVTVLNFGRAPVREAIHFPELVGRTARLIFATSGEEKEVMPVFQDGSFKLEIGSVAGQVFCIP